MDPSANTSMNGSHNTNGQPYNLLDGIQYAAQDTLQNGDDLAGFFDPELFESTTIGNGYSQSSMPMSQDFDPNAGRQSNTPEIHQYSIPQQNFPQHQYQQPFYTQQHVNQSNYDPASFYQHSRPSPSPVGFDGGYSYQPQMGFTSQSSYPQQINITQRQTPSQSRNYLQTPQQQQQPYVNIGPRPTQQQQQQHAQSGDMRRFASFQDPSHQTNRFVDPSMLSANQMMNTGNNTNTTNFQTQPYMPPYFTTSGSTVDPRSIQGHQISTPVPPTNTPQPVVIIPKPEPAVKSAAPAPKRPRGRPRKDGSSNSGGRPGGSESSSDELEIEDEEPPETTPALLSISVPTDERGKTVYHAVQAVWSPRNKSVDPEKVRSGIASYGETIRGLRDAWKTKNEILRKAELPNSPTAADAPKLKDEVARYRELLDIVMLRSTQYGHPAIVKRLGENQFTMSALYSFMLDRWNVSDYDSPLVSSILKFVVKFERLDSEMLELTKLSKLLQRLTKKAATEIKTLSQTVLDNAAAASAKKASDKKSDKPASPKSVGSPADPSRKDTVAGVKRLRDGDAAAQPLAKKAVKVTLQSSKPLAVRQEEKRKAEEAAKRLKTGDKAANASASTTASTSTTNPSSKTKVAVAAPPKSSVFSALSSVSKKPGTSLAERAAAAAKEKATPAAAPSSAPSRPVKKESPPRNVGPTTKSTTSSSFLGLLADMEKKPEKEAKKEDEIPNETEEEKAKRLRKEARRKLRVTWRADDELVETRFFTHDPDEELDKGDRLKANAGGGREGEALKFHKNMDDLDDEEDEDSFEEFEAYISPSEVDFGYLEDETLGDESPHKTNYPKYGGSMKLDSRANEAQDKYEQDTLMAIYTSKADRPPTPKEPDDSKDDEGDFEPAEPETPFGEPNETTRAREREYLARQLPPQPKVDLTALAQAMSLQQRPQQQSGVVSGDLQRALSMYNQPSQPNLQPQSAPSTNMNLQAILQSVLGQQMQSQPQQPQYPAATQAGGLNSNLSAFLASMQQSGTQAGTSTNAIPLGIGNNPNPFPGAFEDSSRKHARSDSNDNDAEYGRKGGNKKKKGGDSNKPYNYKTQPCSFWEQGKCAKGDSCTYRHGDED